MAEADTYGSDGAPSCMDRERTCGRRFWCWEITSVGGGVGCWPQQVVVELWFCFDFSSLIGFGGVSPEIFFTNL